MTTKAAYTYGKWMVGSIDKDNRIINLKEKMTTKKKRKNVQDATLKNIRVLRRRIETLEARLKAIEVTLVKALEVTFMEVAKRECLGR